MIFVWNSWVIKIRDQRSASCFHRKSAFRKATGWFSGGLIAAPSHPASKSCAVVSHWLSSIQNHKEKWYGIWGTCTVPSFPLEAEVNAEGNNEDAYLRLSTPTQKEICEYQIKVDSKVKSITKDKENCFMIQNNNKDSIHWEDLIFEFALI